jgi:ribonuclease P/MRP protein subunit RPP1
MYFELNVPITSPISQQLAPPQTSKKGKGKQPVVTNTVDVVYSPAQLAKIETRLDVLVRCTYTSHAALYDFLPYEGTKVGYTVIALNQLVESKVDPKTHVNILDPLLAVLRKRDGVLLLKRLTILLDAESEKGFGLVRIISFVCKQAYAHLHGVRLP